MTLGLCVLMGAACGDDGGGGADGDGSDGDRFPDASDVVADGGPTGGGGECSATNYECNNCVDDDGDDLIDGDDPECTGSIDDDESSFATGIPGDNKDDKWQDCFFDGNSGAGDDNCRWHTCCALELDKPEDCPVDRKFDPDTDCPEQTQECIEYCGALTPPGCDCFGCCTVCDADGCEDIYINPAVSPDCDQDTLHDPEVCMQCNKAADCGGDEECGGCVLCPGQTEEDLPDECDGMNECPGGETPCDVSADCGDAQYCSAGCCISVVE
ncbi:MAG TPA: hypothetical protein VIG06_24005 [Kofleriaceae bacterium]